MVEVHVSEINRMMIDLLIQCAHVCSLTFYSRNDMSSVSGFHRGTAHTVCVAFTKVLYLVMVLGFGRFTVMRFYVILFLFNEKWNIINKYSQALV